MDINQNATKMPNGTMNILVAKHCFCIKESRQNKQYSQINLPFTQHCIIELAAEATLNSVLLLKKHAECSAQITKETRRMLIIDSCFWLRCILI